MTDNRTLRLAALLAVVAMLAPSASKAYQNDTCDGHLMGGPATTFPGTDPSPLHLGMNTCFNVGQGAQDIQTAVSRWQQVPGAGRILPIDLGTYTNCSKTTISLGDGISDVSYVTTLGSGVLGAYVARINGCNFPYLGGQDGRETEADIAIALDTITSGQQFFGQSTCTDPRVSVQSTWVHELGHVLGMKHENRVMSVMSTEGDVGNNGGAYCDSNQPDPTINMLIAPHADDAAFMHRYHGYTTQIADVVASPYAYIGTNSSGAGITALYPGVPTIELCRGAPINQGSLGTNFVNNIGNRGTVSATVDIAAVAIPCTFGCRAPQSASPSPFVTLGLWNAILPPESMFSAQQMSGAVVPLGTAPGVYWVFTWIDFDGFVNEGGFENNNLSVAFTQLVVGNC